MLFFFGSIIYNEYKDENVCFFPFSCRLFFILSVFPFIHSFHFMCGIESSLIFLLHAIHRHLPYRIHSYKKERKIVYSFFVIKILKLLCVTRMTVEMEQRQLEKFTLWKSFPRADNKTFASFIRAKTFQWADWWGLCLVMWTVFYAG